MLGLALSRAECIRAIVVTECDYVDTSWKSDIVAVTTEIDDLSAAIDVTSSALCDLDKDGEMPCTKETLFAIFDADDGIAKDQVSSYEK